MSLVHPLFDDDPPEKYHHYPRTEMLPHVPPNIRTILDVGCASGLFGSLLKMHRDVEVWGIDACEEAASEATTRLNRVIIADIENDQPLLPVAYFDCIIFNDVLEHLRYPWLILRRLRANLKKGGYVVASIPNVRYYVNMKNLLLRKEWAYVKEGILDKTHLRFFTIKSIPDMFQACGYHVLYLRGINATEFPWKLSLLNLLLFKTLDDMRYLQFACVAQRPED